jgi:RHS repeat-associated protein
MPSDGCSFVSWTVNDAGGGLISSTTNNPATFTFGTANATVTPNFVAPGPVTITVDAGVGGSASAAPASGPPNTQAVLTAVPAPGYAFLFWDVGDSGGGYFSSDDFDAQATFVFGTADATVTAVFTRLMISGEDSAYAPGQFIEQYNALAMAQEPVDTGTGAHVLTHSVLKIRGGQDLNFVIDYDSICRFNDVVGQGWSHNFEAAIQPSTNGCFQVNWNAKKFNIFVPQAGDPNTLKCPDLPVIYDTLLRNTDGTFTLREPSQRRFEFDNTGRLQQIVNPHGQAIRLVYPPTLFYPTQIVEVVSGKTLKLAYNSSGLLSHVTDVLSRTATFGYDSSNRLTSINTSKGPESQTYSFTYDSQGRILTETTPEGVVMFTNTYDLQGRVATQHDAIPGHLPACFFYDESQANRLVTTVVDRTGATNVYVHNALYQLLSITDPLGHTTSYGYDVNGNRIAVTNALGQVQRTAFDVAGNLIASTDAAGQTTSFSYDAQNNLLSTTNAVGSVATFAYDTNNNMISSIDFMSNQVVMVYDTNSLLTQRTSPRGGISTFRHNLGLTIAMTDAATNTFGWGYDIGGRLLTVTDPEGFQTTYNRDMNGDIKVVFDPDWNMTSQNTYDSAGRLLTTIDAVGGSTAFQYDGNGNLITKTNADGSIMTYAYDGEDRLTSVTDGNGHTRRMDYDLAGRLIHSVDALNHTNGFQYDAVGNLIATVDALGVTNQIIAYDIRNQPVSVQDALGNKKQMFYDALQRLIQSVDALNRTNLLGYDALSRLTAATDPMLFVSRQEFDSDGNRTAVVNPRSARTKFQYDLANRLIGSATPTGRNTSYTLNGRGQVAQAVQPSGTQTAFTYDEHGWLTTFQDPSGTILYGHDLKGRLRSAAENGKSLSWSYDGMDRVTTYSDYFGNVMRYAYDGAGNLTNVTYPDGKQVAYAFDAANRLASVTDWGGRVTSYAYDADNRITLITHPNGTITTKSYDLAGRAIHQADLTAASNIIYQVDYGYDAAGQITGETNQPPATPFQPAPISMAYDADDALTNFCGRAVTNDLNGNMVYGPLTNGASAAYTYDARNRLTSVGGLSYQYDPTANRVGLTNNGTATSFVVNPNASLSQVLMRTQDGVTNYYVYGVGLLYELTPANGTQTILTHHYDYRGSTVAITDAGGNVTDRISYSPYGGTTSRAGNTDTPFLFNGSYGVQTDANGLLYMRARYYNATICRFLNPDPLGVLGGPNPYAYADANPINCIDPFGLLRGLVFAPGEADIYNLVANPDNYTIVTHGYWTAAAATYQWGGETHPLLPYEFNHSQIAGPDLNASGQQMPIDAYALGQMIYNDSSWNPNTTIVLAACWAGSGGVDSFAQQLADYLSFLTDNVVTVRASPNAVGPTAVEWNDLVFDQFIGNASRYNHSHPCEIGGSAQQLR